MKIKYCVKPQTVLTVQKENAFFAAPISTSVTILHLWIVHNSQSSLFQKPNSSADGQPNETAQRQHLPLKVLLELEAQWPCSER